MLETPRETFTTNELALEPRSINACAMLEQNEMHPNGYMHSTYSRGARHAGVVTQADSGLKQRAHQRHHVTGSW